MEWALAPLKDKKKALRVKKLEAVTRQEPRLKLRKKTKKGYIKTFNIEIQDSNDPKNQLMPSKGLQ